MQNEPLTGKLTGIYDSEGTPIKSGDTIRYEYIVGFNIADDGTKTYNLPFKHSEKMIHREVMEYKIKDNCAGFFLDFPKQISFTHAFLNTLKYYVEQGTSVVAEPTIIMPIVIIKEEIEPIILTNVKCAVIIFHKNIDRYPKKWIKECFDSIKNQTYKEFDVFEIDYGGRGIHAYKESDFESFELKNHALAHNYLLDKVFSLGYDCAFNVNIDDIYSRKRFETQLPFMAKGYDVVSSNYHNIDENGIPIKQMEMSPLNADIEASRGHNIIAHPVVCYSKHFWTTCTRLDADEIPFDDFELWKRSYSTNKYKFIVLPEYLLYYRIHQQKVSAPADERNKI